MFLRFFMGKSKRQDQNDKNIRVKKKESIFSCHVERNEVQSKHLRAAPALRSFGKFANWFLSPFLLVFEILHGQGKWQDQDDKNQ